MIRCSLINKLAKAHTIIKDDRLGEIFVSCPLNSKQICLWCCLHISNQANPMTRIMSAERNPSYVDFSVVVERDWDSIWETCSKCSNHS
jgi:hypothetical protein